MGKKKADKGKSKEKDSENTSQQGDIAAAAATVVSILSGEIKDDFCNFGYLDNKTGFKHSNVKGAGLVYPEMHTAFAALNVHLAVIDQVFHHKGIEIENIDQFHNHELTALYQVDYFTIKGEEGAEMIAIGGTKSIGILGRAGFDTPFIALDNLSGYKFYNELRTASDAVRKEVEAYMNGKYEPVVKEEKEDPDQLDIGDEMEANESEKTEESVVEGPGNH